jgi:UDP:flavonoid glycosyltransferase YjiC (YdhE family)
LAWPENDWRQATYDETTTYGEHPALHEQELLKALLTLMKEQDTPDASAIAKQLRKARAVIPKDPENWIETVFAAITPDQAKILEAALFDAVKMVE